MPTVDQRTVEMRFNNSQFEKGINESMGSLSKFEGALNQLPTMGNALEKLQSRFSTLGVAGMSVIDRVTNGIMDMGKRLLTAIPNDIVQGGMTRALNLEQAKFQFEGLGVDVEKAMASVDEAVTGTAYGLDEAAKVASQLAASGVEAGDDMTTQLKAVAGMAAMTGDSYMDMGQIFTTVAGNGRVMGEQLTQLSYHGMNAAAALGKYLGKSEADIRDMVSKGEIDFKTFAEAMDDAFGEHAKDANKTYEGALANLHTSLKRIGADIASVYLNVARDIFNALRPIVNNINVALKPVKEVINNLMKSAGSSLVSFFEEFNTKTPGMMTYMFKGIGLAIQELSRVLGPIHTAFENIFPEGMITMFNTFAGKIGYMTRQFHVSESVLKTIQNVFEAFFAGLKAGGAILSVIAKLFSAVVQIATPLIGLFARIWTKIFSLIANVAKLDINGVTDVLLTFTTNASDAFDSLGQLLDKVGEKFLNFFNNISTFGNKLIPQIQNAFGKLGEGIKNALSNLDFVRGLAGTAGIGGLAYVITKLSGSIGYLFNHIIKVENLKWDIQGIITQATKSLTGMTQTVSGPSLRDIAISVALLAGSLFLLASIDPTSMAVALGGLTAALGILAGSLFFFTKIANSMAIPLGKLEKNGEKMDKFGDVMKVAGSRSMELLKLGGVLVLIANAILVLAIAVKILSTMEWQEALVGVGALVVILGSLVGFLWVANKLSLESVKLGAALIPLAIAVGIFAAAMKILSSLGWDGLAQASIALTVILGEMALMMKAMEVISKSDNALIAGDLLKIGGAMLIMATAVLVLAAAMKILGSMSWNEIAAGLFAIAGAMTIFIGALYVLTSIKSEGIVKAASSLLIVAGAMMIMALALKTMSGIGIEDMAWSLLILLGALTAIATICYLLDSLDSMKGAGAVALLSGSVLLLALALKVMSTIPIEGIGAAMLALFGSFMILGMAAVFLAPLAPTILILCGAIAALGLAVALVGAGVAAFAAGLVLAASVGTAGISAFEAMLISFSTMIPTVVQGIVNGFVELIHGLAENIATLVDSIATIFAGLIASAEKIIPPLIELLMNIIMQLLDAVLGRIGEITTKLVEIVIAIINALAEKAPEFIEAVFNLVKVVILEVCTRLSELIGPILDAVSTLIGDILQALNEYLPGIVNALMTLLGPILEFISTTLQQIHDIIVDTLTGVANIIGTLLGGIADIITSVGDSIATAAQGIADAFSTIIGAGADAVTQVLSSICDAFERLSQLTWEDVAQGLVSLGGALGEMMLAAPELTLFGGGLRDAGEAIASMGWGIEQFVMYGKDFPTLLKNCIDAANGSKDSISSAFSGAGEAMSNASTSFSGINTTLAEAQASITSCTATLLSMSAAMTASASTFTASSTLVVTSINAIKSSADAAAAEMPATGANLVQNFVSAIQNSGDPYGAGSELSNKVKSGIESLDLSGSGQAVAQGFCNGIMSVDSGYAGWQLGKNAVVGSDSTHHDMWWSGHYIGEGLCDGINAMCWAAREAGYALGRAAKEGEAAAVNEGSPAKEFIKSGHFIGEGLVIGIQNEFKKVYSTGEKLGDRALEGISNSLSTISKVANDEINENFDPIITPVVDLSNVYQASDDISKNFMNGDYVANAELLSSSGINTRNLSNELELVLSKFAQPKQGDTYNVINGITYDDGTKIHNAIGELIQATRISRRV